MKIGFIIYGSLDILSGGYRYDRKLVEYLRAQGDQVEMISLPWRNYAAHLADNLRFRLPSNFDILIEDELNHPSLLQTNSGIHPCPVVSLVHHLRSSELRPTWQNDFYRILERRYLNSVDGFIFNSETTRRAVNSLTASEKPWVMAHPPTDQFGVRVTESGITDRAHGNELRVLFLGNVIKRKGLHTLLDAVALAHREDPNTRYHLDVVGSLDMDSRYVAFAQRRMEIDGISELVQFHGSLENEALAGKIRQAHVLSVPSSYEGFGIVYLEGMGFGLPAIGTRAGAASEVIEDGKTGYLVEPEEPGPLALCLLHLAADRDLLKRMSINALNRFRAQPGWDQAAKTIREFLLGMIRREPAPSPEK
jgi:glycosyltransferase involved in cell wall biosynthesis